MYRVIIIVFCLLAVACTDNRQVYKTIKNGDLTITWYRKISAGKIVGFVGAEVNGKEDTLLSCDGRLITDVYFRKDTVVIRVFQMQEHFAYTQKGKDHGYIIKPENATYREWLQHYHPEEVGRFDKGLMTDPIKDQMN
ncbi:MAG: hypothetical protein JSU01_14590 [Bacteroidetes bacterium]|nr:hypothetical protein [Bacteroidota bacterium]